MSISSLFEDALDQHGELVLDLEEMAFLLPPTLHDCNLSIKDEYGRLRIWGEQTGAVLPAKARHSLDEQLRDNERTKDITLRSLTRLTSHIEKAIDQVKAFRARPNEGTEQTTQIGEDSDSSSSDESHSAQDSDFDRRTFRLHKTIQSVFDDIRSLYRISTLLKRPRNVNYQVQSRSTKTHSGAAPKVEEDAFWIMQKMHEWRQYTKRRQVASDGKKAVTPEDVEKNIDFLCRRLKLTNMLRRDQLKYWEENPDIPEPRGKILGFLPEPRRQHANDASVTRTISSGIAVSVLAGVGSEHPSRVVGKPNATRVPNVPECSKTNSTFECPFCRLTLDSDKMQDRLAWKEHVFQDLRPYVCSFETCPDPGRLFATRDDWIYHEQQMHRRKWVCADECAQSLYSKAAMVQHLQNDHSHNHNDHQISVYADMCEREVNVAELDQCLICLKEMPLFQLQHHLAKHMVEIALFVLPSPTEGQADGIMTDSDTETTGEATQMDLFAGEESPDTLPSVELESRYAMYQPLAPKLDWNSTPHTDTKQPIEDEQSIAKSLAAQRLDYREVLSFPTPPAARRLDYRQFIRSGVDTAEAQTSDLVTWYRRLQAEEQSTTVDPELVNLITEQVVAKLERSGTRQGQSEQQSLPPVSPIGSTVPKKPAEPGRWPSDSHARPQDLSRVPPDIVARIKNEIEDAIKKDRELWHIPTNVLWSRLKHEREVTSVDETLEALKNPRDFGIEEMQQFAEAPSTGRDKAKMSFVTVAAGSLAGALLGPVGVIAGAVVGGVIASTAAKDDIRNERAEVRKREHELENVATVAKRAAMR